MIMIMSHDVTVQWQCWFILFCINKQQKKAEQIIYISCFPKLLVEADFITMLELNQLKKSNIVSKQTIR